ncbi:MAG: MFS transporter [Chloroflexota bacterium]|nr:MFS transporter [Chloroflexota bacterium]
MYAGNINIVIFISFCRRFHLYLHAYALLLMARGLSLVQISLIESIFIGSIFLMEVPTGILADRLGRKWSIVVSTFLVMCAEFLFIFARDFNWYIVYALLTGIGFAFASGAVEAMIYDSLPPENRDEAMKRAMGRVNSYSLIAFVIAPVIGGLIIGDASVKNFIPAIALTVVALLIGVIAGLTLREPAIETTKEKSGSWELLRDGISLLRRHARLRRLALLVVFTAPFTDAIITTLGPPYLVQNDVSPYAVGVTLSIGSLLGAFTQRYAYKIEEWFGQQRAVAVLILLPGMTYWILAAVTGPFATALIVILMYGTNDMKAPLFSAYQNALIESRNRATVLSLINMLVSLFLALGMPIYAALAAHSLELTFVVMGGVIVAAAMTLEINRFPTAEN